MTKIKTNCYRLQNHQQKTTDWNLPDQQYEQYAFLTNHKNFGWFLIKTIAKLILVWNLLMMFSKLTFMEPGTSVFCYWPSLIVLTVGTGTGNPPQSPPRLSDALLCGTKGGITGGLDHLPLSGVVRILLYCSPSDWLSCTGWNRADKTI